MLTVTLIPTLELSSLQRSVWLSQAGVSDVGMFTSMQQLCLFHIAYVLFCSCSSYKTIFIFIFHIP